MRFLTPAMLTIILLLVVAGLVVAYFVKGLFAAAPPAVAQPRLYPMAVADLEPGTTITSSHLAQGPFSGEAQRTFARSDTVLIGRVVREKISAAQPIDTTRLYAPGERPPVTVAVGMRAVSLDLGDGAAMVDGLAKANDYVDVHFSPSGLDDVRFRGGMTMTLFKGVKVLTINRMRSNSSNRSGNTVTLELSPEQANILLLAKEKGSLNLTFTPDGQGDGGVALADADRAFLEEILGLAPVPEPKKPFVTEHYRNGGRGVMAFDDQGALWSGGGHDGAGANGLGRRAPNQVGGHEATGDGWGGGRSSDFRGINNSQDSTGADATSPRLIPSPQSRPERRGVNITQGI